MNELEIKKLLESLLKREKPTLYRPTEQDWDSLTQKYDWNFPLAFKVFLNLMSEFCFEGDLLNIVDHPQGNGNDTIELTYRMELSNGWDKKMIPFLSIGNGDYLCFNAQEGKDSSVYYVYHEDGEITLEYKNFEEWLNDLEDWV